MSHAVRQLIFSISHQVCVHLRSNVKKRIRATRDNRQAEYEPTDRRRFLEHLALQLTGDVPSRLSGSCGMNMRQLDHRATRTR